MEFQALQGITRNVSINKTVSGRYSSIEASFDIDSDHRKWVFRRFPEEYENTYGDALKDGDSVRVVYDNKGNGKSGYEVYAIQNITRKLVIGVEWIAASVLGFIFTLSAITMSISSIFYAIFYGISLVPLCVLLVMIATFFMVSWICFHSVVTMLKVKKVLAQI